MLHSVRVRLTYANVMVTVLAFTVIGGGTFAIGAIPGKDGKITACYSTKTGVLRAVDADKKKKCVRGEKRITWNQQGIQGVQGTPGVQGGQGTEGQAGSPGTNGTNGTNGVVGPVTIERTDVALTDGATASAEATCPAGQKIISGGASVESTGADDIHMIVSRPGSGSYVPVDGDEAGVTPGFSQSWRTAYRNVAGGTNTTTIRAFALCVE